MKVKCENIYKSSRQTAGLTIEQAAIIHGVSSRTLSYYESGHTKPHDDIVYSMMENYRCPLLGYLHMRDSRLGKAILPEVRLPETEGDAALQVWNAKNIMKQVFKIFKKLATGKQQSIGACESDMMAKKIDLSEQAHKISVEIMLHMKTMEAQNKRKESLSDKRPKTAA